MKRQYICGHGLVSLQKEKEKKGKVICRWMEGVGGGFAEGRDGRGGGLQSQLVVCLVIVNAQF